MPIPVTPSQDLHKVPQWLLVCLIVNLEESRGGQNLLADAAVSLHCAVSLANNIIMAGIIDECGSQWVRMGY